MKKILCLLSVLILLTACGSKPAPEWIGASYNHLEGFKKHYLRGNERLAEKSFQRALEEVKSRGHGDRSLDEARCPDRHPGDI